jgi:hypothetical protein
MPGGSVPARPSVVLVSCIRLPLPNGCSTDECRERPSRAVVIRHRPRSPRADGSARP